VIDSIVDIFSTSLVDGPAMELGRVDGFEGGSRFCGGVEGAEEGSVGGGRDGLDRGCGRDMWVMSEEADGSSTSFPSFLVWMSR
jgi:hypothetical protein